MENFCRFYFINRLLVSVFTLLMLNSNVFAQELDPDLREKPIPVCSAFLDEFEGYLYNTDVNAYFIGANDWQTRASVSESKGYRVYVYPYSDPEDENTIYNWQNYIDDNPYKNGWFKVFSDNKNGIWVDYNNQDEQFLNWKISEVEDGRFVISHAYWGGILSANGYPDDTRLNLLDYEDGTQTVVNNTRWAYVKIDDYNDWKGKADIYFKAKKLYELIAENIDGSTVDFTQYINIYNNVESSYEDLDWAVEKLSEDLNPWTDVTGGFIVNNSFDDYSTNGWNVVVPNAWNKGFQNTQYYNVDISIDCFIEAWIDAEVGYLGDGKISQSGLMQKGTYKLSADCVSAYQKNSDSANEGVSLFARYGEKCFKIPVATGNGRPEHFELEFEVEEPTEVEYGMLLESATANWIAADNFKMEMIGDVVPLEDIVCTPESMELTINEVAKIDVQYVPENPTYLGLQFYSYDTSIATVDKNGYVTGKKEGSTFISVEGKYGIRKELLVEVKAEENDVTYLLVNPDFSWGTDGWTSEYGINTGGLYSFLAIERYQGLIDFYQDVDGVPDGIYEITVNAFYRPGDNGTYYGDEPVPVDLFMNDFKTPVQHIMADAIPINDAVDQVNCMITSPTESGYGGDYTDYNTANGYIPNSMIGASYAFRANRYLQKTYGLVTDGHMRIGLTSNGKSVHWCLWSNFRLKFWDKDLDAGDRVIASFVERIENMKCPSVARSEMEKKIKTAQDAKTPDAKFDAIVALNASLNDAVELQNLYENEFFPLLTKLDKAICEYGEVAPADVAEGALDLYNELKVVYNDGIYNKTQINDAIAQIKDYLNQLQKNYGADGIIINEIQVANIDMFIDPSFNYGGWIEIYNPTDKAISLGSLYVSNDATNLKMFKTPLDEGIVPAHGFKNIWFDHNSNDEQFSNVAYRQVDFKLTWEGGTIYISDEEGNMIASQTYPQALTRISYARTTDGGEEWAMTGMPTPEKSNASSVFASEKLEAPVVDTNGKVFTTPFSFNVTIPEGCTLAYTTDGSTPTLEYGKLIEDSETAEFDVDYSVVYRFRLFKDGYLPSSVVTRSFLYNKWGYDLPIVSITTDRKNLYDDMIGAYVDGYNGTSGNNNDFSNKNRSWERPVNFEYLVPDENGEYCVAVNQEVDFEVCGGWSRHFDPASSFRLKAGKYYEGMNSIDYPFFEDKPFIKTKTLQIRNGGNDNVYRLKDAGIQEIVQRSGFYVDGQSCQPSIVFINGEYQFMFNIREPNNKNFGYSNYGIDTDLMDQFEINGSKGYEQKIGDDEAFRKWWNLAKQLGNDPGNDDIYQQICDLVDIDEYCNYMAAECYIGSDDWLTNSNNVKGFRDKADGKFHLVLMDVDGGFHDNSMIYSLEKKLYATDGRYEGGVNYLIDIFFNMLKNDKFKKQFIDAFCLVDGSVFEDGRTKNILNEMASKTYNAIVQEGHHTDGRARDIINDIVRYKSYRMSVLTDYFNLYNNEYTVNVSNNVVDGRMLLNGQDIPTGKFNGKTYSPVTLTAQAPIGYKFKGWRCERLDIDPDDYIFSLETRWNYYDRGSIHDENWKSLDYDVSMWDNYYSPFGYGDVGKNGYNDWWTSLYYGPDSENKIPTYYFRKNFDLSSIDENKKYYLRCYVDDGVVAYVNGTEIGRYNMRDGETSYDQYSTNYVGSTAAYNVFEIDKSLLNIGQNVVAVEVHNTSANSSDIYWDAELVKITDTSNDNPYLCEEETFNLSEMLSVGNYNITAVYDKVDMENEIATPVRVNEISANNTMYVNTDYWKKDDWVELYNSTDEPIDIAGMYLSDDETMPQKFHIPSNDEQQTIIEPHGHLVVWASKRANVAEPIHTNFKLGNNNGEAVTLTSEDGSWSSSLSYVAHTGIESVGRYPDGGKDVYHMMRPTIGKTNSMTTNSEYLYSFSVPEPDTQIFTLSLSEGWNWVSHPLERSVAVNEINEFAERILSQDKESMYSSLGWTGNLKSLVPGAGYKLFMAAADEKEFEGPFFAEGNTITLHKGWNWIGYPVMGSQSISSALAKFRPAEGDVIVGQNGFATFEDGSWSGDLDAFATGEGYLYKSASPKAMSFMPVTPESKKAKARFIPQPVTAWTANASAYPNVMGVVAKIVANGTEAASGTYSVGAFGKDGECRGVGKYVDGKLFITIYGNSNETITFRAADANTGIVYEIDEQFFFATDVKGTRKAPVTLTIGDATDIASVKSASVDHVAYFALDGSFAGSNKGALKKGVYVAKYTLKDGSVITKKQIMK